MSSLFDSVDDTENVFGSPHPSPSPPPPALPPQSVANGDGDDDDLFPGDSVRVGGGVKSDSGEDRKAVGEREIEGEGEGEGEGAKEEEEEGLGEELIKKEEEEEEDEEKVVQPMSDKEPAEGGTGGEEEFVVVKAEDVPSREDTELALNIVEQKEKEKEKDTEEEDDENKTDATPAKTDAATPAEQPDVVVADADGKNDKPDEKEPERDPLMNKVLSYSQDLSYEERAAMRKYQRQQRKVGAAGASKKEEKPPKPSVRSDHGKTKTTRVEVTLKSRKPPTSSSSVRFSPKNSPRPSPSTGRRVASSTSLHTDTQEQLQQLASRLQKIQLENAALTRDKKRVEAQLDEEKRKIRQLESALAKKDAEILDLKRKAKASPSHVPVKKGESPSVGRKVAEASPRLLKRVGSGEKGTPTGSPAEAKKPRGGVTKEATSSVADTRKKFIKTVTALPEIKRKPRPSRSDDTEETKVTTTKDKPPLAPKKESAQIPPKPSKPVPPVKSERVKSPVHVKPVKATPPPEQATPTEKATPTEEKTTPPTPPTNQVTEVSTSNNQPPASPVSEEPPRETPPTSTSSRQATPSPEEEKESSKSHTVSESSEESKPAAMEVVNATTPRSESPSENGLENGGDEGMPRALRLISSFEKKSSQQVQGVQSWKTHIRKKSGDDVLDEEMPPAKPSSPLTDTVTVSPPREINPASSPQLAQANTHEEEEEEEDEEEMQKMAMYVSGTDVPLREKVLKKSLSNTSTEGKGQSLSMFDNRTKRSSWMNQQKEVCEVCKRTVYAMERLEADKLVYHKTCFKCHVCSKTLGVGTYAALQGTIYCKVHFKQLFKIKGNYDEGFGREQHKTKWSKKDE